MKGLTYIGILWSVCLVMSLLAAVVLDSFAASRPPNNRDSIHKDYGPKSPTATPTTPDPLVAVTSPPSADPTESEVLALVLQLDAPNAPDRIKAINRLVRIDPDGLRCSRDIAKKLVDPVAEVRAAAGEALASLSGHGPFTDREIRSALRHRDMVIRLEVLGMLPQFSRTLQKMLLSAVIDMARRDLEPRVRRAATQLLPECDLGLTAGSMGGAPLPTPTVYTLRDSLSDSDPDVRAAAAGSLARYGRGARVTLPELERRAVSDSHPTVRSAAAEAVRVIRHDAGLPLVSSSTITRPALTTPSTSGTIEGLLEQLGHRNQHVRLHAVQTLAARVSGGPLPEDLRIAGALSAVARDPDHILRLEAMRALAAMGKRAAPAEDELIRSTNDTVAAVKEVAIQALGSLGSDRAVEVLVKLAQTDYSASVRSQAVRSLGGAPEDRVLATLCRLLRRDADAEVRAAVAQTLRGMGGRAELAAPTLAQALRDPSMPVRRAAMTALVTMGPKHTAEARPTLERLRSDSDSNIRSLAEEVLRQLDAAPRSDAGPLPPKALGEEPRPLARTLPTRGSVDTTHSTETETETLARLLMYLNSPDARVRRDTAADLAAKDRDGRSLESLIGLLTDPVAEVRAASAGSVAALLSGHPERVGQVVPLVLSIAARSGDTEHRRDALRLLAQLPPTPEAVVGTQAVADGDSVPVLRVQAIATLASWGGRSGETLSIERYLDAADPGVRRQAAVSLGRLGIAAQRTLYKLEYRFSQETDDTTRQVMASAIRQIRAASAAEASGRRATSASGNARLTQLIISLREGPPYQRGSAAHSLVAQLDGSSPEADAMILDALKVAADDSEMQVRCAVAQALGSARLYVAEVLPLLMSRLSDPVAQVRFAATRSLGRLRTEAAAEGLRIALFDDNPSVRSEAIALLGQLSATEENLAALVTRVRTEPTSTLREATIEVLCRAGPTAPKAADSVAALLDLTNDSALSVRMSAIRALAKLGPAAPDATRQRLNELVNSSDIAVQRAARHTLDRLNTSILNAVP